MKTARSLLLLISFATCVATDAQDRSSIIQKLSKSAIVDVKEKTMKEKTSERLDWWQIDQAVTARLAKDNNAQLAKELQQSAPAGEAVKNQFMLLDVAGRFAMQKELASAISKLATLKKDIRDDLVASAADFLIGKEQFKSAQKLLEAFPKAQPGWGYVLVEKLSRNEPATDIDRWIAQQAAHDDSSFWISERVRFREKQGTAIELLNAMKAEVTEHPQDSTLADHIVAAASHVSSDKFALDWMGTTVKLKTAFDSYRLAESLRGRSPKAAVGLLERSLSLPYTQEDQKAIADYMRHHSAMPFISEHKSWEKELRDWSKGSLAQAYQADGQAKKAQPLMVELAKTYPNGVPAPGFSQFAGQVQAASGTNVVETSIKKAEPENKDSAKYWLSRMDYYIGRNDHKAATDAFEKALALANDKNDDGAYDRSSAVNSYCRYLQKEQKTDDRSAVMRLLRREFDKTPAGNAYASRLVSEMLFYDNDITHLLHYNDEKLWAHLTKKEPLDTNDQQLVRHMAFTVQAGAEKPFIDRLSKLVSSKGARSCATVGNALLSCHDDYRVTKDLGKLAAPASIAPLKRAVAEEKDDYQRGVATSDLFNAYIATNDWKSAESMSAARGAATDTIINQLQRLAVAAARSGAYEQSLSFWKKKDQIDPSNLGYLDELAKSGMKERLRKYYQDQGKSMKSAICKAAMDKLEGH